MLKGLGSTLDLPHARDNSPNPKIHKYLRGPGTGLNQPCLCLGLGLGFRALVLLRKLPFAETNHG